VEKQKNIKKKRKKYAICWVVLETTQKNDSKRFESFLYHKRTQNCWIFVVAMKKCHVVRRLDFNVCLVGNLTLITVFELSWQCDSCFPQFEIIMTTLDKVFTQIHAKAVFSAHVTWHHSILSLIDRTVHLNFDIFWGSFVCFPF
jgi:hypothetical protein